MTLDIKRARQLLKDCNLIALFIEELGWDPCKKKLELVVDGKLFKLNAIAQKIGFIVWECQSADEALPNNSIRLKLDRKLSETSFEHLIIFTNQEKSNQSWVWVRREKGKPLNIRSHEYQKNQSGDSLLQKLESLYVSLEDEEGGDLSTINIASKAKNAFDIEKITKSFYRDFDIQRKSFLEFIDGIGEVADKEWYASVMLNRLMFVYFIQRKGFLDGDKNYLRNRLNLCIKEKGHDNFYNFYRYFLLRLFHEGFSKRKFERPASLEKLIGSIPYLNGGLFDVHELEKPERYGKDINIPDKAFQKVFDYFDQYQWHLDERPLKNDNEINPDVLGYIFEKYINQKQMGAYYTKEDITEYIGKNTILPFILEATKSKCSVVFESKGEATIWNLIRDNPDRYIYEDIRHGCNLDLPEAIKKGQSSVDQRELWNSPTPPEFGLPTEIWRDTLSRRDLYQNQVKQITAGKVNQINDLISLNLNIRQFTQDLLSNCEGPDLLMSFWQSISSITILDPTGGSGAFIFAALNILEVLYEGCLERMELFLSEWGDSGKKLHPNYFKKFHEVLTNVSSHPNRRYFILKSIILNNLYAVDIMEEAVEICKLRLFLKLAAQVEPDVERENLGIEPLPDIDFNIRSGNSLVGYATYQEVERAIGSSFDFDNSLDKISKKAALLQSTFDNFRRAQTENDVSIVSKSELNRQLKELEAELNGYLAGEYAINLKDKKSYSNWLVKYQPFHWFVQFYGIINAGGFDVIIGNPPFVEYSKVKKDYTIPTGQYQTENAANLYAYVVERSTTILNKSGSLGMILPLSGFCTQRMTPLINLVKDMQATKWIIHSGWRPSKLFDGVNIPLSMLLAKSGEREILTTTFLKWYSPFRPHLFPTLSYAPCNKFLLYSHVIPKIGSHIELSILEKVFKQGKKLSKYQEHGKGKKWTLYYRNTGGLYWRIITNFRPKFEQDGIPMQSSTESTIELVDEDTLNMATGVLNSNLFWFYYVVFSSFHHVNPSDILDFPIDFNSMTLDLRSKLMVASDEVMKSMNSNSEYRQRIHKGGNTSKTQTFFPSLSKTCVDDIDRIIGNHYGFTPDETDYIINYDVKYRIADQSDDN